MLFRSITQLKTTVLSHKALKWVSRSSFLLWLWRRLRSLNCAALPWKRIVRSCNCATICNTVCVCLVPCTAHLTPVSIQSMAKTIQELSETNAAMSNQFSYREKYWLHELNVAKAKIAEFEAQFGQNRQFSDSLALQHSKLESKYSRLLDIRNRLLSRLTFSLRM